MALAIDASTPVAKNGTSTAAASFASNTFSPPAGSLILVAAGDNNSAISISSMAGTGLTNFTVLKTVSATARVRAEIWVADCASGATNTAVTVTWASSSDCRARGIAVLVLNGAAGAVSQTGLTGSASNAGGAQSTPSASVASAAATSWIFGYIGNWDSSTVGTPGASQTITFNANGQSWANATVGDSGWLQGNTAAGNSNLTISDTAPILSDWAAVVVEIQASTAAPAAHPLSVVTWPHAMFRSAYR